VVLARVLQERGVVSAPESVVKQNLEHGRRIPDVLVEFMGLRIAVEGEVDDQADAERKAMDSATRRVEEGIAHVGVAVVYPARLRQVAFGELPDEIAGAAFRIAVTSESGATGFAEGGVEALENALRAAFFELVREDVVTQAAQVLDGAIDRFARTIARKPGTIGKVADVLELRDLAREDGDAVASGG